MKKGCNFFLFFFLTTLSCFAQGPISGFMPKDGQLDAAFTYSTEQYDNFWTESGEKTERNLDGYSYSTFLEYGVDKKTALVLTVPYIQHNALNKGWQDAGLWLKYRNERTEKPLGFSNFITAIGLSFPLSNYSNDNPLAIGNRATTFQGRLQWQYEARYGWFFNIQSGIDFQFAPSAKAALPILIRGGIGTSWFYTDLWLEHYQSLNGSATENNISAGPGSSWTKSGMTLYFPVQPWVGLFTSGSIILGGKNIGQSKRLNFGAVFRINAN